MAKTRVITAAIGIPVLLGLVWLGGWWLGVALLLLAILGCAEFVLLAQKINMPNRAAFLLSGLLYICLGFLAFFGTRLHNGTVWLLLLIWTTDAMAYEYGRKKGWRKLAPRISPNKTVEGAVAGLISALIIGCLYGCLVMKVNFFVALLVSCAISCIGQLGDLLESKIKRMADVKDSGKIFPGHGGVLDRFDSILLSSMFMYLFLVLIERTAI